MRARVCDKEAQYREKRVMETTQELRKEWMIGSEKGEITNVLVLVLALIPPNVPGI